MNESRLSRLQTASNHHLRDDEAAILAKLETLEVSIGAVITTAARWQASAAGWRRTTAVLAVALILASLVIAGLVAYILWRLR